MTKELFRIRGGDGKHVVLTEGESEQYDTRWLLSIEFPANGTSEVVKFDSFDLVHLYDLLGAVVYGRLGRSHHSHMFAVETLDQVNEGREVWITSTEEILDEDKARQLSFEARKESGYGKARVVRVTRSVISTCETADAGWRPGTTEINERGVLRHIDVVSAYPAEVMKKESKDD